MKGIIFTAFSDMVEEEFGLQTLDEIMTEAKLPHGGAYTAGGTYPFSEMERLVTRLHAHTNLEMPVLLESFGYYLFSYLHQKHQYLFSQNLDTLTFLSQIHQHIHVEVQKLYSDAALPTLEVQEHTNERLVILYKSARKLGNLARGLIRGCIDHFGEAIDFEEIVIREDMSEVRFVFNKRS